MFFFTKKSNYNFSLKTRNQYTQMTYVDSSAYVYVLYILLSVYITLLIINASIIINDITVDSR